jgi:hypothetical protein
MFCKILKLTNGDTVIGNIVEETKGYVEVHRPMRIIVAPAKLQPNSYSLSMMKWDPLLDYISPVRIFKQTIIAVADASTEVSRVYIELYDQIDQIDDVDLTDEEDEDEKTVDKETNMSDMSSYLQDSSNTRILH